jgi:hypothetical protein
MIVSPAWMPKPDPNVAPQPDGILVVEEVTEPPPTGALVPFTCPWAQDGLRRAMEGMVGPSSGVQGYKIGTRAVTYRSAAEQGKAIDYWMKMVEYYCGASALPPSLTGRDTAFRVIPRDV